MSIDAKTTICAIIGNPVEHSLSPAMHNAGYEHLGLNFSYCAFRVDDPKDAVAGIGGLHIKGISVTVPHKVAVMPFLDVIDDTAKKIGAVNTILNENGKLTGYNTDYIGAIGALEEKTTLKGKKVIVIGAGGAARAVVFGLMQKKAQVLILNRTTDKAKELAKQSGASYGSLERIAEIAKSDILVHATSIGMHPDEKESAIPKELLHKNLVVFDIVYNPKETKLLQDAKQKGATIVYGYKMLLYQAVGQFEMFTKQKAPVAIMEDVLVKNLAISKGKNQKAKVQVKIKK